MKIQSAYGFYHWWPAHSPSEKGMLAFVRRDSCIQCMYRCTEEEKECVIDSFFCYMKDCGTVDEYLREFFTKRHRFQVRPEDEIGDLLNIGFIDEHASAEHLACLNQAIKLNKTVKPRKKDLFTLLQGFTWFSMWGIDLRKNARGEYEMILPSSDHLLPQYYEEPDPVSAGEYAYQ